MGKIYEVRVDLINVGLALLNEIKKSYGIIEVYPGDLLGGPKKREMLISADISQLEEGFTVCPVCFNVYSISALKEFVESYSDMNCLSCNRIPLREILRKAMEVSPR